jgi:hypothetical protein
MEKIIEKANKVRPCSEDKPEKLTIIVAGCNELFG